jgi:hypothetical protein
MVYEKAVALTKIKLERSNLMRLYQKKQQEKYKRQIETAISLSLQSGNAEENMRDGEFTYENLLLLGERLGKVNVGLSQDEMNTIKMTTLELTETCSICLNSGDTGKLLLCGHFFHTECIDQWLSTKKSCPLCLAEVKISDYL